MKNSKDTIGDRTSDLPACSAVPQPTEPPRAGAEEVLNVFYVSFYLFKGESTQQCSGETC
jgi:hypothetical protein